MNHDNSSRRRWRAHKRQAAAWIETRRGGRSGTSARRAPSWSVRRGHRGARGRRQRPHLAASLDNRGPRTPADASTTQPQINAQRPAHAQSNTQAVSRGVVRSSARKPPSLGKCASSSTALVVASTVVVVTSHTSKATENKGSGRERGSARAPMAFSVHVWGGAAHRYFCGPSLAGEVAPRAVGSSRWSVGSFGRGCRMGNPL